MKGNVMETYESDYRYRVAVLIGVSASAFLACVSISLFLRTGDAKGLLLLVPSAAVLYATFLLIPKEISIETHQIVFRTLFADRIIRIDNIGAIREFHSHNSLMRAGGDKEEADMLCFIRMKRRPWRIIFFGNHILEYKRLSTRLKELTSTAS